MPAPADPLPGGLYERLITKALRSHLDALEKAGDAVVRRAPVHPRRGHATLARHIERVVACALRGLQEEVRKTRQPEIANRILELLTNEADLGDTAADEETIAVPPEELHAVRTVTGDPARDRDLPRPLVALSASDLLVNARGEPGLAHALAHEIPSADSIDLLCAFVRWHGLRLLADQLEAHCRAGRRLRVITTVFTGSTERKALDWLVARGAQVKVLVRHAVHAPSCESVALPPRHRLLHRLHRLVKSVEVSARGRRGMERAPIAGGLAGHP